MSLAIDSERKYNELLSKVIEVSGKDWNIRHKNRVINNYFVLNGYYNLTKTYKKLLEKDRSYLIR